MTARTCRRGFMSFAGHLIPMQSSGSNVLEAAKQQMPGKLVLCTSGSRFTFTA